MLILALFGQRDPLYQGFRPLGDGSTNDLVDLALNNPTFWPPEGQEWLVPADNQPTHNDEHEEEQQEVATVDDPFDTVNMHPYLSPSSLFAEEETAMKRRMASNCGSYDDTFTHHDPMVLDRIQPFSDCEMTMRKTLDVEFFKLLGRPFYMSNWVGW